MTKHTIQRDKLGSLTKIGQGGQGIVFAAPGFRTKFTDSMVFKEYKSDALLDMDFNALSAMPVLVEDSMSYEDAERLISIAAWPCALVEQDGRPIGQVMPAIPAQFTMPLTTARGTAEVNAEIQHLLNHQSILAARGIKLDDNQRYSLLREIAGELAFLHRSGICVGDISPKNLLFSLTPTEAAYFIDCDTMAVNGVSALPQVETPGWEVPEGESPATIYSDSYKFGLLALRLIVGDQDARDPAKIPAKTPHLLRKVITDALTNAPEKRPLPTAWTYILGHALEEVQQRQMDSPSDDEVDDVPAPPVPVVRTRPKPSSQPKSSPSKSAMPRPATSTANTADSQPAPSPNLDAHRRNRLIGAGIAAAAVLAVVIIAVTTSSGGGSYTPSRTSTPGAYGGSFTEPTSEESTTRDTSTTRPSTAPAGSWGGAATSTAIALSPPPSSLLQSDDDPSGQYCTGGISLGTTGSHFAARGSAGTSCFFAENVGRAYANSSPNPGSRPEQISAAGSVGCSTVPGNPPCTRDGSDYFIMTCSIRGGDRWITCTGGNKAVVYVY